MWKWTSEMRRVTIHKRGGGQGGRPLPPPAPYLLPPAPLSPSSLLERRALRARKIFLLSPPSLFSSPLPPPAPLLPPPSPSSPSSRPSSPSFLPLFSLLPPLFSLLPPPLLAHPAPSSPSSLPLFSLLPPPSSPPSRPLISPSLLPCPPPHKSAQRSEAQRFYEYRDASHLWRSFSQNTWTFNS